MLLAAALAAVIVSIARPAQAENELERFLEGKSYDQDKLLEEFDDDTKGKFQFAGDAVQRFDSSAIALILPLDAPGFVGEVANAFLEGFVSAAENAGGTFPLETYRTDGKPQSGLVAYRQAVSHGAGMIIGPLLRSSVEQVAQLPAETTVPTILLQEPSRTTHAGQLGAPQLYSFPLGGEVEILQLAQQADQDLGTWSVYVMVENSPLGRRLEQTFLKSWRLAGRDDAKVRSVVGNDSWQPLHDEVRFDLSEPDKKAIAKTEETGIPLVERPDYVAVFAAGGGEFASQTRANMPSAAPVYVLASSQDGLDQGGRNILVLSGIRFFEMPYVLDLRAGHDDLVAASYAAALPLVLQRYVAAGIDAYELASGFGSWGLLQSWEHQGATGRVTLIGSRFQREGRLLELSEGTYIDISPEAEDRSSDS